jgi:xanthine dehydrogenase accessory factor
MGIESAMTLVLVRGGGDLASGVALRLHRCRFQVIITELERPFAVRRRVSFAEAVYRGATRVEECTARRVADPEDRLGVQRIIEEGDIPVLIDPEGTAIRNFLPAVVVDARMLKQYPRYDQAADRLVIGLGPGFVAGENCDAVVETNRGLSLGRVVWKGPAEPDTSVPETVGGHGEERVLRSPADGPVIAHAEIGDRLERGQLIAEVGGQPVRAAFKGRLRGLIFPGTRVEKHRKIGDLDPRGDWRACTQVSDKSLAVAGGVLEAILSRRSSGSDRKKP